VVALLACAFILTTISIAGAVFSPVWADWRESERHPQGVEARLSLRYRVAARRPRRARDGAGRQLAVAARNAWAISRCP
jgi:hypothetical protein